MTTTDPGTVADYVRNISMEAFADDPNEFYDRVRSETPLVFVPQLGMWIASSKQLCDEMLADPETWQVRLIPSGVRALGEHAIVGTNREEHRELREMVQPHLRPSAIDGYIDQLVRPHARRLLEAFDADGRAELVSQYCEPLSVRCLGDLLGLPDVTDDTLRDWFHALSSSAANAALDENGQPAEEGYADGDRAQREIVELLTPRLARWREHPDHSAISHWLHDGMPEGHTRPDDVIFPTLNVFLLGGMQEPGHAMSTTLAGLLTHPDQLDRVLEDPSLLPRAIQEGVRWVAPIWTAGARTASRDVELGGILIPSGSMVMPAFGAANRDPAAFEHPADFDIARPVAPNLAFGGGPHACAGNYFATAVVRIGMEELLDAIPNLELDPDHEPRFWGWVFRGVPELHVTWEV